MYDTLLDDSTVTTLSFPTAEAEIEYVQWLDECRRAHAAEIDAAYDEWLEMEARHRQLFGAETFGAFNQRRAAEERTERMEAEYTDATPEQDSGEDDGPDREYLERSREYYRGLGDLNAA